MHSFVTTVFLIVLNTAGIGFLYLPYTFQVVGVTWAAVLVLVAMGSTLLGLDIINTLWHLSPNKQKANTPASSTPAPEESDELLLTDNMTAPTQVDSNDVELDSERMIKSYTELMRVHLEGKEKYVIDVAVSMFALLLTTLVPALYMMFGIDIIADIAITVSPDVPADKTWIMIAMVSFEIGMVMSSNWVMNQIKIWASRLTMISLALFAASLIYFSAELGFVDDPVLLFDTDDNDRLFPRVMHVFLAYLASFFYTLQVPEIALGMKNHSPLMVTMSQVAGILVCGMFSFFVGAFGFFVFGNTTLDPNIINNLPNGVFTGIVRGFIVVTVLVLSAIYVRLSVSLIREILRTVVENILDNGGSGGVYSNSGESTPAGSPRPGGNFGFSIPRNVMLKNAISRTSELQLQKSRNTGDRGILHKNVFTGVMRVLSIIVMVILLVVNPNISSIFEWIGAYSLVHLTTSVPAYVLIRSKHVTFEEYPVRHVFAGFSVLFGISTTVISIVLAASGNAF